MNPLIKLTTKLTNPKVSVEDKLKEICLVTSSLIQGAHRVSLWRFSKSFQSIESLICYDTSNKNFTSGLVLNQSDYSDYFTAILKEEVINAPFAREHEQTKCFKEAYLEPLDIHSLLDFILHRDFNPHGIICCESVGQATPWTSCDVEFLRRIASASSMYFKLDD